MVEHHQWNAQSGDPTEMDPTNILSAGAAWYAVFLASITLHEAAHALVALKLGDPTAYHNGQVSLSPTSHIKHHPLGMIAVPIISFVLSGFSWMLGWAAIPCDRHWMMRYPKRSALVSAAGPAANFALILLAIVVIRIGYAADVFLPPKEITFSHVADTNGSALLANFAFLISILFSLNIVLCAFNLIPLPPLDGSGILPAGLSHESAQRYFDFALNPAYMLPGLAIAWMLAGYAIGPLHTFAVNLLYPGTQYG
jgi:Zn-dependent protease